MVITFRHDGRSISIRADRIKSVERIGDDTVIRTIDGDEYGLPECEQHVHDKIVTGWNDNLIHSAVATALTEIAISIASISVDRGGS